MAARNAEREVRLTGLNLETLAGFHIPRNTTVLYVSNNLLKKLPDLPPGLKQLFCDDNLITELPNLPRTLEVLSCSRNQITHLPELPASLDILFADDNKFEPPFDKFFRNFRKDNILNMGNLNKLKEDVNGFYANIKKRGRNLAALEQTLERAPIYSIVENTFAVPGGTNGKKRKVTRNKRNVGPRGNTVAEIAEFLSGVKGSLRTQKRVVRSEHPKFKRGYHGGTRKTRRVN